MICTYEKDHLEAIDYPIATVNAMQAARSVVEGGVFAGFKQTICSAAWMGELGVYNPHQE